MKKTIFRKKLSSFQIILLGFLAMILSGSLILMLPFATNSGISASFKDTLFTATSAVCVTGLIVQDTATFWSPFGQAIILLLIQIGGVGVITVALSIATVSGRKINLMSRSIMQESISAPKIGGIVTLTGFILRITFIIEFIGALLMFPSFYKNFGIFKGIWYSIFHSVSAFCNAGFDLMGVNEKFSSLTSVGFDVPINITAMLLIIIGGIGFLTWDDIKTHKFRLRRYRMQSKVVLVTSAVLIIIPFVLFLFFEFNDMPAGKRVLASLFQAVTLRTAGFNTVDYGLISHSGLMLMIVLMLIGGSPGSTAGGMKTTTVAVLFSSLISVFKRKDSAGFFGRRISDSTVKNAATILVMYLTLFISSGCIISRLENLPLIDCLYETASAIGTVGLTLGITPSLSLISKGILIILMFLGRVGGLTVIYAALSSQKNMSKLPLEKITVG